ncbi:FGGY-family carbohydrate kinase [Streptomyces chiangmaiensis]
MIGVDIGTSSSKGVLVALDGTVIHTAVREHTVDRPAPGHSEMDGQIWWEEFVSLTRELTAAHDTQVVAVGVSGMGPCVLLTDEKDQPVRPAVLYGVDTRSVAQIARLEAELGPDAIVERCGSRLTSQAAGPKIAWIAEHEPEQYARARRLYMPSSWLVRGLTGAYVLDHHSASQCTGLVTPEAARLTGLPAGIPVTVGTIDAWAEALSVGAHGIGDLMLMYGTAMFLVHTVPDLLRHPALWSTVGALPGTRNLAGGMATSGAVTGWLRDLFAAGDYGELLRLAGESGPGARGLLMLPYFAGERTPVDDPRARGVIAGLTLSHTRGDLYRAALEATAFGVRHNIETLVDAGGDIGRVVAVGGGVQGGLWTRIVSDVTGRAQELRATSVGAGYGGALLAAQLVSDADIDAWNPVVDVVEPHPETADCYDRLYALYRELYPASAPVVHALADLQTR